MFLHAFPISFYPYHRLKSYPTESSHIIVSQTPHHAPSIPSPLPYCGSASLFPQPPFAVSISTTRLRKGRGLTTNGSGLISKRRGHAPSTSAQCHLTVAKPTSHGLHLVWAPGNRALHLDLLLLVPEVPASKVARSDPATNHRNCNHNCKDDPSKVSRNPICRMLVHDICSYALGSHEVGNCTMIYL